MPSRFLTLWSMLANKPASSSAGQQPSKKTKIRKDAISPSHEVRYRAGYSPMVIPIYGEEEEFPVQLQLRERERPSSPSIGLSHEDSASSSTLISEQKVSGVALRDRGSRTLTRSSSIFRRSSHFFRRNRSPAPPASPINRNHKSVDSLPIKRSEGRSKSTDSSAITTATVAKSVSVGGLTSHRSSLRVCQAKRVAPPIVPDSATGVVAHRHSGSSFDSTGGSLSSAESTASGFSGGYCSGSGGSSSATASWSSGAGDQRSSIGLDESLTTFGSLPPPPASPAVIAAQAPLSGCSSPAHPATPAKHLQHMYRGESEPVYSSRNPASPSFGNPGGIFTYPNGHNNSNGIYGQIGGQHNHHRPVTMMESLQNTPAMSGPTTLLSHPNFSHQLSMEDQGIDLTQSPGRESPSSSSSTVSVGLKSCNSAGSGASSSVMLGPGSSGSSGSSCRHSTTSTTSLDSGRASGTYDHHHHHPHHNQRHTGLLVVHHQTQQAQVSQQRFSGQSYESCLRNSYHSSSSSLGSAGSKIDDIHRLNVCEMLSQGVPEHEILNAWLTDLGFEEYYDLFVQSGYDMHTITRMTPEDLTAIGIQKPNHRKKLKSEIALLHIPDGLPDFIPDTLEEWLALLGLAEYSPSLRRQGYRTVEDVTQLTWEDLEDFGILRLGHQKKITLAIKRVKDILAGKYTPLSPGSNSSDGSFCAPEPQQQQPTQQSHYRCSSSSSTSHYAIPPSIMRPVYFPPQQQQIYQHYQQQHIIQQQQVQQKQQPIYNYAYQQPTYQPDVVAIQVHRNRSSEDVRANAGPAPAGETVHHQQTFTSNKPGWRQRSYEDGDVTPVSEHGKPLPGHQHQVHVPGGGTLPRPRGTVKPRPVAKISAKTRSDCSDQDEPNLKGVAPSCASPAPQYGTLGKKHPPPAPPKRASSSSITEVVTVPAAEPAEPIYSRNAKSSPLPLPPPPPAIASDALSYSSSLAYSDDSEDFPPPPAPITASDSYLQHHNGQHPGASAAASVRERLDNILQRSGAGHWPARPQQSHYGVPTTSRPSSNTMAGMKMMPNRECSPSDSIDNSDTEPGSPAMEFRQRRNGSDASFKSTSSTESDSMPFANDNAGTIKQRNARTHPALAALNYSSHSAAAVLSPSLARRAASNNAAAATAAAAAAASTTSATASNLGASDVLNDIGNMLADLTDELDSMLEEESSGNHSTLRKKS